MWNECGEVTEFMRGNVILALGDRGKSTPAQALAGRDLREATVRIIDELSAVRRAWFVNALRGLVPVHLRNQ